MKTENFMDYFKFPLKYMNPIVVNTSDDKRIIDFLTSWRNDDKVKRYIVGTLNGEVIPIPEELEISDDYRYENCEIYLKDRRIMRIRGWDCIVGTSKGRKLSPRSAINIQNEFGEFIVNKLKFNTL